MSGVQSGSCALGATSSSKHVVVPPTQLWPSLLPPPGASHDPRQSPSSPTPERVNPSNPCKMPILDDGRCWSRYISWVQEVAKRDAAWNPICLGSARGL